MLGNRNQRDRRISVVPWVAAGVSAAALFVGVRWLAKAAPPDSLVSSQPENVGVGARLPAVGELKYVGAGGCAAAACHGGPIRNTSEMEIWNCSYTIWASQSPIPWPPDKAAKKEDRQRSAPLVDKHNHAYSVLFEDRSKQIVRLLDRKSKSSDVHPERDARCVACHSVPVDPASAAGEALSKAVWADGIGCEMCHGPAKRWLAAHTADNWLNDFHSRKFDGHPEMQDMRDTRDLLSRARTCAECHVGSPASGSQILRDVNHDLIAAGHPRLNFAFHAFLGVMPKHWTDKPDPVYRPGFKPDSQTHAEAWAIGQAVAAEAALRLLADRASAKPPATEKDRLRPWPEFSEYDCYACHHQLDGNYPSSRQAAAGKSSHKLGQLPWGSWYYPELEVLLSSIPAKEFSERYAALSKVMSAPPANLSRNEVAEKASAAATALHNFADQLGNKTFAPAEIDALLHTAADVNFQPADWDEAAERFLTLDALWKARDQLRGDRPSGPDEQLAAEAIEKLRQQLEFKLGFDSPKGFDADSFVKEVYQPAAAQIRKALGPSDSK